MLLGRIGSWWVWSSCGARKNRQLVGVVTCGARKNRQLVGVVTCGTWKNRQLVGVVTLWCLEE